MAENTGPPGGGGDDTEWSKVAEQVAATAPESPLLRLLKRSGETGTRQHRGGGAANQDPRDCQRPAHQRIVPDDESQRASTLPIAARDVEQDGRREVEALKQRRTLVLAHTKTMSWPRRRADLEEQGPAHTKSLYHYLPLEQMLTKEHSSDAHFVGYLSVEREGRLSKTGPADDSKTDSKGAHERLPRGIVMVLQTFDVDCAAVSDTKAPAPDAWRAEEETKVAKLLQMHPNGYAYHTKSGYRIVYWRKQYRRITSPKDDRDWTLTYQRTCLYLTDKYGIVADPKCADWTRHFRCPDVIRDRVRQQHPVICRPDVVGEWDYEPSDANFELDIETAKKLACKKPATWNSIIKRLKSSRTSPTPPNTTASSSTATQSKASLGRRVATAKGLVAAHPAAVSGDNGHTTTLKLAMMLVGGCNLPKDAAFGLLRDEYNQRCEPRWDEDELRRKVDEADRLVEEGGAGRGHFLATALTHKEIAAALGQTPKLIETWIEKLPSDSAPAALDAALAELMELVAGRSDTERELYCKKMALKTGVTLGTLRTVLKSARARVDAASEQEKRSESRAAMPSGNIEVESFQIKPLAEAFLEHCRHDQANRLILRHFQDELMQWDNGKYRVEEEVETRKDLWKLLERVWMWLRKAGEKDAKATSPTINTHMIKGVQFAIPACDEVLLRSDLSVPRWLITNGAAQPPPLEIVPCRNGLLWVPERKLIRPTPHFFNLNAVEFDYDANAPEPTQWLAFLGSLWGYDGQSTATLQEMFGLMLTADTSQQKAFLLLGPKRSGKGTIGRILAALIGEGNMCAPTLAGLSGEFGLQPLLHKSLAIVSDARLSGRADKAVIVERILSITGEDALTVNRKYKEMVTGKLGTRIVILTNEMPALLDASGALASRFIVLVMTKSFYGHEDKTLINKLLPELPGILNWALDGWDRLQKRGYFIQPWASTDVVQEMNDLTSPIAAFLRDNCVLGATHRVVIQELFDRWGTWCDEEGRDHSGTKSSFGRNLRTRIPDLKKKQATVPGDGRPWHYMGIKLKGGVQ